MSQQIPKKENKNKKDPYIYQINKIAIQVIAGKRESGTYIFICLK